MEGTTAKYSKYPALEVFYAGVFFILRVCVYVSSFISIQKRTSIVLYFVLFCSKNETATRRWNLYSSVNVMKLTF